jgi:hypothetical protein
MHYGLTKEIWDKIQNIYEYDERIKKEKIQNGNYMGFLDPLSIPSKLN